MQTELSLQRDYMYLSIVIFSMLLHKIISSLRDIRGQLSITIMTIDVILSTEHTLSLLSMGLVKGKKYK